MVHAKLSGTPVKPAGVFGDVELMRSIDAYRAKIDEMRSQLDEVDRREISRYLRDGYRTIAPMEVTPDILEGRFSVPGGSGFMTDGTYFWRTDASEYVSEYGIGVPEDLIEHIRHHRGVVPDVADVDILGIDRFIYELLVEVASRRSTTID